MLSFQIPQWIKDMKSSRIKLEFTHSKQLMYGSLVTGTCGLPLVSDGRPCPENAVMAKWAPLNCRYIVIAVAVKPLRIVSNIRMLTPEVIVRF